MFARRLVSAAAARGKRVLQRRSFGGHHVDMTKPFEPPHVASWHKKGGEACMAVMFFWMLYRAKEDGAVLIVRVMCELGLFGCFRLPLARPGLLVLWARLPLFLSLCVFSCGAGFSWTARCIAMGCWNFAGV